MLNSLLLATALWPNLVTQHCAPDDTSIMVGVAQNPAGGILYCEIISNPEPQLLHLKYVRDNKVFATKELSFKQNALMPDVLQQDTRFGELRQSNNDGKSIRLQYQANTSKKLAKTNIPIEKVDIVDAGFDNFIRANWEQLQNGQPISVNFASITHQKILSLRISNQSLQKCNPQADAESAFCFLVEIDNALLRLLLGNIHLTYDQQHRLIKYDGMVNIEDDKEDSQIAIIHYYYQQAPAQPATN